MATTIFTGGTDTSDELDAGDGRLARRERRRGVAFVSPWLVGLVLFFLFPIVASFLMSFTNYELVQDEGVSTQWVGLENWRTMWSDPDVRNGLWVTLKFGVMFIPAMIFVPLLLAYLLTSDRLWGRSFFRAMFYLPSMVPFVAGLIVWQFYLNDVSGWFPRLLRWLGWESVPNFLNEANWVLPMLVFMSLWGIGNAIIIFIAALNGVPTQLYEAAKIDGASKWRLFRDVTWPMISPITFYNVIIALVGLGQYFVVPFILLGPEGPPDGASRFYTMVFFQETFTFFKGGYGAALAWGMFIVVFTLTAILFRTAKYWVHYEYEER
ncbi:MAG: sugar ABC transporter permease [Actinomycetota bacterium]